uniref:apical junction component 1 homolog n=1 Tax=Pristiophorus japonicus TaxID=55135 RepID=UPI00398E772B
MTRTDPPDILVSTVYREIKVSPMPGEPKVSQAHRKCDASAPSSLQDTQQYINKRQCRSFDFLQSLESQPDSGGPMEEYSYRRPDRRAPSPELAWDSLGRQVYLRSSAPDLVASRLCAQAVEPREAPRPEAKKRGRSKSAPRVKTTYRAVPVEVGSPEAARRGREARRVHRDSHKRAEASPRREPCHTARTRMNEVHPIKLQPQRGDASLYSPLFVSDSYESYEEYQSLKPGPGAHVRYRVDMKPEDPAQHPASRAWKVAPKHGSVASWQSQPGRSLTVPANRRVLRNRSPSETYSGEYWTLATHNNCSPHQCYRDDCRRGPPQREQTPPTFSEQSYPDVRRLSRQPAQPNIYYTEERARPSQHRYASPMHYHDWWGTNRAAHGHQGYMSPYPSYWDGRIGYVSPYGSCYGIDQHRLGSDSRHYSKSWDNILSPSGRREFPATNCRSYETLPSPEKRPRSPEGRRQPTVVNLSRSPQRYAALSLSESSIAEKLQGEGGRGPQGRSWYITPEITITDNDLRANGPGKAQAGGRARSRQALDGGNSLSASFNDLLSCNLDNVKETGGSSPSSSPHQPGKQQLDDVLADLVIDTCKTPATRRPSDSDTLVDQLRKLITGEDLPGEHGTRTLLVHTTEPQKMKVHPMCAGTSPEAHSLGMSRSPSYPSPCDGPPQDPSSDDVDTMMCSNLKCGLTETLFNARLYFKSCHSCYTYYCSRNCRKDDWEMHKEACVYGRVSSTCKRVLRSCRENQTAHKAFSRIARMGYLSRGKGVLFLGFPNPASAENFLQYGLESLLLAPTYLSVRELEGYADHLGEYLKEIQEAGKQYDPEECFLLNVSIALGQKVPENPSPRLQTPTVRRFAKIALASTSPEKKVFKGDDEMETLILTPPPGTTDIDKEGESGRKAREVCFINVQRELRIRGVFLRHEYPKIYQDLCEFVESNKRFTPTTIYPIDKRTGKQFMCMIMAASEPLTLEWVRKPNLLEDMM